MHVCIYTSMKSLISCGLIATFEGALLHLNYFFIQLGNAASIINNGRISTDDGRNASDGAVQRKECANARWRTPA